MMAKVQENRIPAGVRFNQGSIVVPLGGKHGV